MQIRWNASWIASIFTNELPFLLIICLLILRIELGSNMDERKYVETLEDIGKKLDPLEVEQLCFINDIGDTIENIRY